MAKILITLSAVLLAVAYMSFAAPSLDLGIFALPVPMDTIPGVSEACTKGMETVQKDCNATLIPEWTKSKLMKEMIQALSNGAANAKDAQEHLQCCIVWDMMACMEAGIKTKCTSSEVTMLEVGINMGKDKVKKEICPDYQDASKCSKE